MHECQYAETYRTPHNKPSTHCHHVLRLIGHVYLFTCMLFVSILCLRSTLRLFRDDLWAHFRYSSAYMYPSFLNMHKCTFKLVGEQIFCRGKIDLSPLSVNSWVNLDLPQVDLFLLIVVDSAFLPLNVIIQPSTVS